jgi:hypothetical protein
VPVIVIGQLPSQGSQLIKVFSLTVSWGTALKLRIAGSRLPDQPLNDPAD